MIRDVAVRAVDAGDDQAARRCQRLAPSWDSARSGSSSARPARRAVPPAELGIDDLHPHRLPDERAQQLVDEELARAGRVVVLGVRGGGHAEHVARRTRRSRAGTRRTSRSAESSDSRAQRIPLSAPSRLRNGPPGATHTPAAPSSTAGPASASIVGVDPSHGRTRDREGARGVTDRGLDGVLRFEARRAIADHRDPGSASRAGSTTGSQATA